MAISVDMLKVAFPVANGFTCLPTPWVSLTHASERDSQQVWAKRDDLSGSIYGGNKTRKLEFLLGEALRLGAKKICTVGAIGSNHVLATALHARSLGLDISALHFPQPMTPHVLHNLRALSTLEPDLTLVPADTSPAQYKAILRAWRLANADAFYIPAGGSSPLGAIGYAGAALELIESWPDLPPDVIVVAAGTCGTLAGLKLGFCLAGWDRVRLVGVRVVERSIANTDTASRLARGCASLITKHTGLPVPQLDASDFEIVDGFFGEGYGMPTPAGREATEIAARDALCLDPTYTAKTFAAALQRTERRVLYWHTLSGVDLAERLARADLQRLPAEYHHLFKEQA